MRQLLRSAMRSCAAEPRETPSTANSSRRCCIVRHPCEVSCAVQLTWPSHGKAKIRRPRTLSDTSGRGGPSSPCDLQGLRANLTLRSTAFRHAARLSITIAIAATIYRVLDLPRGYWVPLTVFFVLRPDFGSTFTRGLQRYIVTALGAVLATLISAALNPGPYALAAVLGGAIFAFLYAKLRALYGLDDRLDHLCRGIRGVPEYATTIDRLLDTTMRDRDARCLCPMAELGALQATRCDRRVDRRRTRLGP